MSNDVFKARTVFEVNGKRYHYYRLTALEDAGVANVARLPYSIKVLLESVLRQMDGRAITKEHVEDLAKWGSDEVKDKEVPFAFPLRFCRIHARPDMVCFLSCHKAHLPGHSFSMLNKGKIIPCR